MVARHRCISISPSSPARVEMRPAGREDVLAATRGLTPRDAELLAYLDEHRVLTALQAARLLFGSYSRARSRLAVLYERGVLARFRRDIWPGTEPWRYTLGVAGAVVRAAATEAERLPRAADVTEKVLRLAHSSHTDHLVGVNDFFATLAGYARTHDNCQLARWEPEAVVADACGGIVRPDAYGEWIQDGSKVGFFYEHDTGSEPLKVLVGKIAKYRELSYLDIRRPVFFRLPNAAREGHLHQALQKRWSFGPPVPVAITSGEQLVPAGNALRPASPCAADAVWLAVGATGGRRRLAELRSPQTTADPPPDTWPRAA